MKRALVTGAGGFVGSHVVDRLVSAGFEVTASLSPSDSLDNLKHLGRDISRTRCDIVDSAAVRRLCQRTKPNWIFHLAGFASVGRSFSMQRLTYDVNFVGALNMLEAAQNLTGLRKMLVIGSADSYGVFKPTGKLLKESQPFNPVSPYGASKAAMEAAAVQFAAAGLPVTIARPFNHTGPRQSDVFALPSFCRQIAEIELRGRKPVISVGDLSVKRDMSDVRDIADGYLACIRKGTPGRAYHFSSGKAPSMRSMLATLLSLSPERIEIKIATQRLRKADIPVLRGDSTRARTELGFKNRRTLSRTLEDTLNFWRERVAAKR